MGVPGGQSRQKSTERCLPPAREGAASPRSFSSRLASVRGPTLSGGRVPVGQLGRTEVLAAPPAGLHPIGHREVTTQGSLETGFIGVAGMALGLPAAHSFLLLIPVGDYVAQGLVVDVARKVHRCQGEHLLHLGAAPEACDPPPPSGAGAWSSAFPGPNPKL